VRPEGLSQRKIQESLCFIKHNFSGLGSRHNKILSARDLPIKELNDCNQWHWHASPTEIFQNLPQTNQC